MSEITITAKYAITIVISLCLDAIIGDPTLRWHPVRALGVFASHVEAFTRRVLRGIGSNHIWQEKLAGLTTWLVVMMVATISAISISSLGHALNHWVGIAMDAIIVWASIAPTDLARHALRVEHALKVDASSYATEPLRGREAVSMLVGRDVSALNAQGIARACIESIAESSIDGVAAPIFFGIMLCPWAAFAYRALNTMDSMFGHKNERYLHFGLVPARADDLANWLPARLSSITACLIAPLAGGSAVGACRSFIRWRSAHESPNSGHPESTYAGAFNLCLGGPTHYADGIVNKLWINPHGRDAEPADIKRALRLMYIQTIASLVTFIGLRAIINWLLKAIVAY